ncbi:MAG: molybdenum cofactor guanylyltransferase, partial [Acidimicrobiia bacterium]
AAGAAGLTACGHDGAALLLAVDLPFVEPPLLELLAAADAAGGVVLPLARGERQPTCAVYSRLATNRAAELLRDGQRSLQALLRAIAVHEFDESSWRAVAPANALDDVDTPDDLARFGLTVDPPR